MSIVIRIFLLKILFYKLVFPLSLWGESSFNEVSFYKEIKPIFQANCNGCHQPAKMKGDYLMTEFASLLEGETVNRLWFPGNRKEVIF